LIADWQVINGDQQFFAATKAMHNALQGAPRDLDEHERATYLANAQRNAALMGDERYDFIFVHDPQPAPLLHAHGKGDARWVWRCHIDTSQPNPDTWAFLRPHLDGYDAAIYTMAEFIAPDLPVSHVAVIPPAIDPFSPKNLALPELICHEILEWIGISPDRPLITQISRFDPWKDPLGVIAAYRSARERVGDLQLVLAGSMALDDPEGFDIYGQIAQEAASDPDIRVLTNLTGVGNLEVNALQRSADVVVQKSLREGFGLVISEALWKLTPVVAGRAGGIPLQMADGTGGILVDSIEECADAIVRLLTDRALAADLAGRGQARVRQHFLLPRLVLNELSLMLDLAHQRPLTQAAVGDPARRDPVCGMAIAAPAHAPAQDFQGHTFHFCSDGCRARFRAHPERYARTATSAAPGQARAG
jgi:trehalose synthase